MRPTRSAQPVHPAWGSGPNSISPPGSDRDMPTDCAGRDTCCSFGVPTAVRLCHARPGNAERPPSRRVAFPGSITARGRTAAVRLAVPAPPASSRRCGPCCGAPHRAPARPSSVRHSRVIAFHVKRHPGTAGARSHVDGSDLPPWCRALRGQPSQGGACGLHVYPTQSSTADRCRLHTRGSRSRAPQTYPTAGGKSNAWRGDEDWSGRLKALKRDCRSSPVRGSDSTPEQPVGRTSHSQPHRSRPHPTNSSVRSPPALMRWLPTLTGLAGGQR